MIPKEVTYESVVLTAEIFDRAASSNGGFSRAQLALFGITFPPIKGWKEQLLGTLASREVIDEFIALKDRHLTQKRHKAASQRPFFITVDYSIPWNEQYKHPNWQKMRLYISEITLPVKTVETITDFCMSITRNTLGTNLFGMLIQQR